MADEIRFTIEFEDDPVKNAELGGTLSRDAADSGEAPPPTQLEDISNIQAGSEDAARSYLSILATTIQTVKPNHTLLVWRAHFHPSEGRRFQSASITCKFSAPGAPPAEPLEVVAYAPRKSFGGCSRETTRTSWTVSLPLPPIALHDGGAVLPSAGGAPASLPSRGTERWAETEHAFTLTGSARGAPRRTACVWTAEENASARRGIPAEVQLAAVVRHLGPLRCDVRASAKVAGGLLPPRFLRAKTPAEDCGKVIEPSMFAGRLFEYDLRGEGDLDALLKTWTGEVAGSVLEFETQVIRP